MAQLGPGGPCTLPRTPQAQGHLGSLQLEGSRGSLPVRPAHGLCFGRTLPLRSRVGPPGWPLRPESHPVPCPPFQPLHAGPLHPHRPLPSCTPCSGDAPFPAPPRGPAGVLVRTSRAVLCPLPRRPSHRGPGPPASDPMRQRGRHEGVAEGSGGPQGHWPTVPRHSPSGGPAPSSCTSPGL